MSNFYNNIESPLRGELEHPGSLRDFDWLQISNDIKPFLQDGRVQEELNGLMRSFYQEYVYARDNYTRALFLKRTFVQDVFRADALAGDWALDEVDVCEMAERWMLYGKEKEFKDLLIALIHVGYHTSWDEVRRRIDEILRRMEVEGTHKGETDAGTFYCLVHGFTMIASSSVKAERKDELIQLFVQHWDFLRYVYSVMLRCIVGCGFSNFVSVANHVANMPPYAPFLHLFYAPLQERFDDLCQKGAKQEKLKNSLAKLSMKMKASDPDTELDELCEILFPEEFRDMLNHHRPKSYKELEGEISKIKQEMQGTIEVLNEQINALAAQLSDAVKASVPIEDIERELLRFPSQQALPIFMQLNTLLMGNVAWSQAALAIRNKILEKQDEELKRSMSITAHAGSIVNGMVQQQSNYGIETNRQFLA